MTPLRCWLPGIPLAVARLLAMDDDRSLPDIREARGKRGGFGAVSEPAGCIGTSLTFVIAVLGSGAGTCIVSMADSVGWSVDAASCRDFKI